MWHIFSSVSANEFKREFEFGLELIVRFHVVAGHTEYSGTGFHEILVFVTELHRFCGAAGGIVFGVEIQHHGLTGVGSITNLDTTGCIGFKFRKVKEKS